MHSDLIGRISSHFTPSPPTRLAVAVSGGGDSVALLHLLAEYCASRDVQLYAITVDHGLRASSAEEAQQVAKLAKSLSIPHETLRWADWDGSGNLQDQARRARYRMMTDWAQSKGISLLALGHTADDQAETVLMRLARSSGVDGLAAMQARRLENGVTLIRPLLGISRAELRDYLVQNNLSWSEDPSNFDTQYDRIKIRQAMDVLAPLGITTPVLTRVAEQMGQAREALDWYSFLTAREIVRVDDGDIVIDLRRFRTLPNEIARRLLVRSVMWVSGAEYKPRRSAIEDLIKAARVRQPSTLGGCIVSIHQAALWISREFNAVRALTALPDELWDNRWHLQPPVLQSVDDDNFQDFVVRALGPRGLVMCPDWKHSGKPRVALLASPAIWHGDELVSAPLAGRAAGWTATLSHSGEEFFATLLSH
jgi:tRNA(Ile)-lysidine synthase